MSDTGDDSDDNSQRLNYQRVTNNNNNKKRKIVMKIEFNDSDETSSNSSSGNISDDDDDPIKPSCSTRNKTRKGKRHILLSSEDDSSSGSEITRAVVVKGRKLQKAIIIDEEKDKSPPPEKFKNMKKEKNDENGFTTDSSSDGSLEKCPICLLSFRNQEIGTPETCDHVFCAICIEEWSKNVRTCPIDRREFQKIIVHDSYIRKNFTREIKIDERKENGSNENIGNSENDITYCEICRQSNREDIMLLCDGCNQGYHMDCLTPPLDEIPDGYWYCDNCFESDEDEDEQILEQLNSLYEDLREMGVPETRFRIREVQQPRIIRTRQSERIRANIVARTRRNGGSSGINIVTPIAGTSSSSSILRTNLQIVAEPSSTSSLTARTRNSTNTTAKPRRRRTRRKRRKRRTYVVEYDVNNYDEKFALKTTKKYVRKRKSRRKKSGRRRSRRSAAQSSLRISNGTRSKLAAALGIDNERLAEVNSLKQFNRNFSIFGNRNDLEYFSDESDDLGGIDSTESGFGGVGGGTVSAIQTSVRLRSLGSLTRRKGLIQEIQPPIQQSQTIDVLSSIMDLQDRWHSASQRIGSVRIEQDGTLNFEENRNSVRNSNQELGAIRKSENTNNNENNSINSSRSSSSRINPNDIINAPLYPRGGGGNQSFSGGGSGGGGGNYNNRYNNQSNYRNSTGGSSGGQQYNNRNSTGNINFSFNTFRRDFQQDNSFFLSNPLNNTPNNNRNRFNNNNNNNNRNQQQQQQQQQQQLQNQIQRFERRSLMTFPSIRDFNLTSETQLSNENLCSPLLPPPSIHSMRQPPPMQQLPLMQQLPSLQQPPPIRHTPPMQLPTPISVSSISQPPPPPPPPVQTVQSTMQSSVLHSIPSLQHMQSVPPPISLVPPPPPPLPQQQQQINKTEQTSSISNSSNASDSVPIYGPMPQTLQSSSAPQETNVTVPPLAPPPWNNNLFRLTNDYGGDDDDDDYEEDNDNNCPNFSVYSAESMQVARSSEQDQASKDSTKTQQEDEYDDKVEDLVQLGDDDDIPAAIDNNKNKDSNKSKIYEPENPTTENDDNVNNDNDIDNDNEMSIDNDNKNDNDNSIETTTDDIINNQNKHENDNDDDDDDDDDDENKESISEEKETIEEQFNDNDSNSQIHSNTEDDNDDEDNNRNESQIQIKSQQKSNLITKKIEFKIQRPNILQLYDDSDWEEWNIEKPIIGPKTREETERSYTPVDTVSIATMSKVNESSNDKEEEIIMQEDNIESNQTTVAETIISEIEEPDRSYTPCLDEKNDQEDDIAITPETPERLIVQQDDYEPGTPLIIENDNENVEEYEKSTTDLSKTVIDGIETELISEGEDEEILNDDNAENKKKNDKGGNKEETTGIGRKSKKEQFKKISKNTKDRNYRGDKERVNDKPRQPPRSRSRSRSRNRFKRGFNNKNDQRSRKTKRKELERYNVRNVINQPRTYKDRYGRDTSRPPRSRTPRSRSRSRHRRSRSRSLTLSRSRSLSRNHSFSISPSPESYGRLSQRRRRSLSPRRSRTPRRKSRSVRRSRTPPTRRSPIRKRSRSPLRLRPSRSNSPRSRLNGSKRPRQRTLSPLSSRSKSPLCRSRSELRSRSRSRSNIRMRPISPRKSRSRSVELIKKKRKRSKDRKKKKTKKQRPPTISLSPSPQPSLHSRQSRHSRTIERQLSVTIKKKKKRTRTKSPIGQPMTTWSPSPPALPEDPHVLISPPGKDIASWTPPLLSPSHPPSLRVVLNNNKENLSKKKREKKKKAEKRRESTRKEKRRRRSEIPESPIAAPSKEVFASGDNILVSVSFNKEGNVPPQQQTTVVTLPPTREEIISRHRTPEKSRKRKKSKEKIQRRHKKIDAKPIAIIDLDRSPFQEIIQSPRDIIVLTDSDQESGENRGPEIEKHHNNNREIHEPIHDKNQDNHDDGRHSMHQTNNNSEQNMSGSSHREENIPEEPFELQQQQQQLGPKTPPEPPIVKFNLTVKNKQIIKASRNPLHDEQEEIEDQCEQSEHEEHHEHNHSHEMEIQNTSGNKIGPNTPPESGPCSPDVYDPFDPTKSPSLSPSPPPPASTEISSSSILEQEQQHSHMSEEQSQQQQSSQQQQQQQQQQRTSSAILGSQEKNINPVELVMALMSSKTKQVQEASSTSNQNESSSQFTIPGTGDLCSGGNISGTGELHEKSDDNITGSKGVTVVSNVMITPGKTHRQTSLSSSANIPTIASPVSKNVSQTLVTSTMNSTLSSGVSSQSIISKLPLPKLGNIGTTSNSRQNGGASSSGTLNDDNILNEIESPYSPGSEDYEDLFEPPPNDNSISLAQLSSSRSRLKSSASGGLGGNTSGGGGGNKNNKTELFDNLFGSTSPIGQIRLPTYAPSTIRKQQTRSSNNPKSNKKTPIKENKKLKNNFSVAKTSSDDQIKVFDELPNSAVEMQVKDKFLRKLYRQERVVDEVKLVLKPHYIKKHISKEDYKEILRRAVPKICHSRSGEINPKKIQNLVEAYVKKFRQRNKLGIGIATGQVSSAVKCAAYLKKL